MKKLALVLLFGIGCLPLTAGCSKDHVLHGMYDGLRVHNDLQSTPAERMGRPESPGYGEYERMRNERSRQNDGGGNR